MGRTSNETFWNVCGTPGTVYGTKIGRRKITLTITLPETLLDKLADTRRHHLIRLFHHAILPVVETIFIEQWKRMAGKTIDGAKMPDGWDELFSE